MDLESDPDLAAELCRASYERLVASLADLTDEAIARPSRLPDWSVGHVLTHLARNADAHARRLQGALRGQAVPKYPGGGEQRAREIEAGATRPAADVRADLDASQGRLEDLFEQSAGVGWPNPLVDGDRGYGPRGCPAHRLREIEMHHVDLGLDYRPDDWPEDYVAWDLEVLLSTVPARVRDPRHRRDLMAWLAGRSALPTRVTLDAWG